MRAREREVALIVAGHRHDRAGPVLHQHVGGHEARHLLAVHRIHGVHTERDALPGVGFLAVVERRVADLLDQRLHGAPCAAEFGQLLHERVLDREHEERHAPERVRTRGEDPDLVAGLVDRERDVRALAAPDPVALHREHALRPFDERVHVVEQALRVVGDLEEPLRQVAALDHRAAALTRTLDHLLVRQHGLVLGAPVDGGVLAVRQAALEEPQEQPLRPAVVLGIAGAHEPRPVERHPHPLERGHPMFDVRVRPLLGMDPALDRGVLRVQTEGIEADRVQHVVALHPLEASHHVAAAERLRVAHV